MKVIGNLNNSKDLDINNRVYGIEGGEIPTIRAVNTPNIGEYDMEIKLLRIRKLTENECMRLMGFEKKDTLSMKEAGLSKSIVYHSAGDSIVTTCLVGLFGALLGKNTKQLIIDYSDKLSQEEQK